MVMAPLSEAGLVTGTADKDYNLISFAEACLSSALRMEHYIEDARKAGDDELARLFVRAQLNAVRDAEDAKALLVRRMGAA